MGQTTPLIEARYCLDVIRNFEAVCHGIANGSNAMARSGMMQCSILLLDYSWMHSGHPSFGIGLHLRLDDHRFDSSSTTFTKNMNYRKSASLNTKNFNVRRVHGCHWHLFFDGLSNFPQDICMQLGTRKTPSNLWGRSCLQSLHCSMYTGSGPSHSTWEGS